ncbi:SIS domain-containing protein [Paenibacillus eucommiae]|uniref:Glucosamine--fructose-6-phosphate aminotransferase (Isomerizing) n=1 Tax=Paenibacillus eucommiae TaxID=1355755 RepID=A0ABS4J3J9_9BACL|nr:SIS domain-containing protein [Paenibacillus eucommiae]MBP1993389.1 glucosamine--fructose-6-phosphate aminotransferase (isomerizing) [Paenibacillus eucommiae]
MEQFGAKTYPEISSQTEALEAALAAAESSQEWITKYLCNDAFDEVVFIGSGSSFYQAQTMASTYRVWTGRTASAWPSSEVFLFRDQALATKRNYLLIGVSRSGESSEVILALKSVSDLPNWTLCGITCYENSTMAQLCPCLVSPKGKEESTVMTKSFSSMTYMMQVATAIAAKHDKAVEDLKSVPQLSAAVVKSADGFVKNIIDTNDFNKYIYLGMGAYFGLAQEACLKIKEMSYVWTESYGTLEFRHGPKSVVDEGTFICVLLSEQAKDYEIKVAAEMKAYGASVLLITAERTAEMDFADAVFEIGGKQLSDEARSVLYLPALQFLGYYCAIKKNVNPDNPRNLTQVVII